MTRHRIDLHHAAILTTQLAETIDQATRHLQHELHHYDSLASSSIATITTGQPANTSVEHAVIQRQQITDDLYDINLHVTCLTVTLNNLGRLIHRANTTRTPAPRCDATGRQGAIEWGDPNCWDIPARAQGKLCQRCYMREYRWRQAHGLPTRDDAAAA